MPSQNALLEIAQIDTELESYLTRIGKISYRFPAHDSGVNRGDTERFSCRFLMPRVKSHNVPLSAGKVSLNLTCLSSGELKLQTRFAFFLHRYLR